MKIQKIHIDTEDGLVVEKRDGFLIRGCGKRCFASRKRAAEKAKSESRRLNKTITYYKCPNNCHSWHLGTPPGQREENGEGPSTIHRKYLEERQDLPYIEIYDGYRE